MSAGFLGAVQQDVEMRQKTDRLMSGYWLLLPASAVVLFAASGYAGYTIAMTTLSPSTGTASQPDYSALLSLFVGLYAWASVFGIAWAIMIYRMIKRRNRHFRRQQQLFDDLLKALTSYAASKSLTETLEPVLAPARDILNEIKAKETQREALVWVIVGFFIDIVFLFVYYFLMKDFYRHERREEQFLERLSASAASIGIDIRFQKRSRPTPNRSFALYLVLSIFTVGLFWFYWLHRLIKDPNQHFLSQRAIEDAIVAGFQTI